MAVVDINQGKIDNLNVEIAGLQSSIDSITKSSAYQDCLTNDYQAKYNSNNCGFIFSNHVCKDIRPKLNNCISIGNNLKKYQDELKIKQTELSQLTTIAKQKLTEENIEIQKKSQQSNTVLYIVIGIIAFIIIVAIIKKKI